MFKIVFHSFYIGVLSSAQMMKSYPLPSDSLIKWEVAPRDISDFTFQHPLRQTRWDDLEIHYRSKRESKVHDPLFNLQYVRDIEARYFAHLFSFSEASLPGGSRLDPQFAHMLTKSAQGGVIELLDFPFKDVNTIHQFQDGVEEVRANATLNNLTFLTNLGRVMGALQVAEGAKYDQIIQAEREVYRVVDAVVEQFPDVSSKLWTDLRLFLLSSQMRDSPLDDYRQLLHAEKITMTASLKGVPVFDIAVGGREHQWEQLDSYWPSRVLQGSYQRWKAFSLIKDVVALAITTIGVAHTVDAYGLARAEFGNPLSLTGLGHPLLYYQAKYGRISGFQPNDVRFSPQEQLLFVTGPTEGGKTTVARSVGTAVLMAHAIGYVCAESARVPLFTNMLSSFVHTDDFASGISTFRAEAESLNAQYAVMDDQTFFVGDETLRTSEPSVGPELLPPITRALLAKGITGVIATHYHDAIRQFEGHPQIKCQQIKPERFFALEDGVSPGGYAFESAQRAGLHPELLGERARDEYVSPEKPSQSFTVRPTVLHDKKLPPHSLEELMQATEIPHTKVLIKTRLTPLPKEN